MKTMSEKVNDKARLEEKEEAPLTPEEIKFLQVHTRRVLHASLSSLSEHIEDTIHALNDLVEVGGYVALDEFVANLVPDFSSDHDLLEDDWNNIKILTIAAGVFPERLGMQLRMLMAILQKTYELTTEDIGEIDIVQACVLQKMKAWQDHEHLASTRGYMRKGSSLTTFHEKQPIDEKRIQREKNRYLRRDDAYENVKPGPRYQNTRSQKRKNRERYWKKKKH